MAWKARPFMRVRSGRSRMSQPGDPGSSRGLVLEDPSLVDLRPAEEVVEAQERAEDQAGAAVEEPEADDVGVEESDQGPQREPQVDPLELPLEPLARPDRAG